MPAMEVKLPAEHQFTRVQAKYVSRNEKLQLKFERYQGHQYTQVVPAATREELPKTARPEAMASISRISRHQYLNLEEGEKCVVTGTLYKQMKLKPTVLDEYSKEVAGPLISYKEAFPLQGLKEVHVHKFCAQWAQDVYSEDDKPKNLACKIRRGKRIKCCTCGKRGAAFNGCCNKRCKKSFHYPCGRATPGCTWDENDFVMFCPQHANCTFPKRKRCTANPTHEALLARDREAKHIREEVSSEANLARERQLSNFFCLTLLGKWFVTTEWMEACQKLGHPVAETKFKVMKDVSGVIGGSQRSRENAAAQGPNLLQGLSFYFSGEFKSAGREDRQSLVTAGGGIVLQRKPLRTARNLDNMPSTSRSTGTSVRSGGRAIVIYDGALTGTGDAFSIARQGGAHAVPHSWLLDSVATFSLHPIPEMHSV